MPDVPKPEDLGSYVADLERRIRLLESAPRLKNASISDDANVKRAIFGQLDDGDFGLEIRNETGIAVYQVSSKGQTIPRQQMYVTRGNDYITVTSGSYVSCWEVMMPYTIADAVQIDVTVSTDAATTANLKITCNLGSSTSAIVAVPALTSQNYSYKWAVPGLTAGLANIFFQIQVQRTSGAGNVYVYTPINAFMTSSTAIGATPTGR